MGEGPPTKKESAGLYLDQPQYLYIAQLQQDVVDSTIKQSHNRTCPSTTAEHVCIHQRSSEQKEDESWSAALFILLDLPGGGYTIVEIAKGREI